MPRRRDTLLAERLDEALERSELKVRALARRLAGEGATEREVESERRQLHKALSGEIETMTHERSKAVTGAIGDHLPPDHFVIPNDHRMASRRALEARLEAVETRLEDLARLVGARDG